VALGATDPAWAGRQQHSGEEQAAECSGMARPSYSRCRLCSFLLLLLLLVLLLLGRRNTPSSLLCRVMLTSGSTNTSRCTPLPPPPVPSAPLPLSPLPRPSLELPVPPSIWSHRRTPRRRHSRSSRASMWAKFCFVGTTRVSSCSAATTSSSGGSCCSSGCMPGWPAVIRGSEEACGEG